MTNTPVEREYQIVVGDLSIEYWHGNFPGDQKRYHPQARVIKIGAFPYLAPKYRDYHVGNIDLMTGEVKAQNSGEKKRLLCLIGVAGLTVEEIRRRMGPEFFNEKMKEER